MKKLRTNSKRSKRCNQAASDRDITRWWCKGWNSESSYKLYSK